MTGYRPSYGFDYALDPRMSLHLSELCELLADRDGELTLHGWCCAAARPIADHLGLIFDRVIGSTLADISASTQWFRVATVAYVALDEPTFTVDVDLALRDAIAWYLHVGHGEAPASTEPAGEALASARRILGEPPYWRHRVMPARVPSGATAETLRARWHMVFPPRAWDFAWPPSIDLRAPPS